MLQDDVRQAVRTLKKVGYEVRREGGSSYLYEPSGTFITTIPTDAHVLNYREKAKQFLKIARGLSLNPSPEPIEVVVKAPTPQGEGPWYSVKEASEMLGMTATNLHALIKKYNIPIRWKSTGTDGRKVGVEIQKSTVDNFDSFRTKKPSPVAKPKQHGTYDRTKVAVYDPVRVIAAVDKLREGVELLAEAFLVPQRKEVDNEDRGS